MMVRPCCYRSGSLSGQSNLGFFRQNLRLALVTGSTPATNLVTLSQKTYQWSDGLPTIARTRLAAWPSSSDRTNLLFTQYLDGLWRHSKLMTQNPGERQIIAGQTAYDEDNRVFEAAIPYYLGDAAPLIVNTRDVLGRGIQTTKPFGPAGQATTTISTNSFVATATGETVTTTAAVNTAYADTRQQFYQPYANKRRVVGVNSSSDNALQLRFDGPPHRYLYAARPLCGLSICIQLAGTVDQQERTDARHGDRHLRYGRQPS